RNTLRRDPPEGVTGFGLVVEHPDAVIYKLNEEHGFVDVSRCDPRPEVGDLLTVVPNHACGTVNMHDEMVLHRDGGEVVDTWQVGARGKIRRALDGACRRPQLPYSAVAAGESRTVGARGGSG